MQVILTQNVPHLGSLGDEVSVKNGFARNYLLPRGFALAASSQNAAHVAHRKKLLEKLRAQAIDAARAESEKVAGLELLVRAKAGLNGKLFGSVTTRDLQAALKELGYELDRRAIILHAPIKNVGAYTATVKLHSEVKTEVRVRVQPIELTEEERKALLAEQGVAAEGEAPAEGAAAAEGAAPAAEGTAEAAQAASAETPAEPAKKAKAAKAKADDAGDEKPAKGKAAKKDK